MRDAKILITGATGRVARPVAESLAAENEVWCAARFSDPAVRVDLEAVGIHTFTWDFSVGDLDGLPDGFTHVMHAAILPEFHDFDAAIRSTVRSVGMLMAHCRDAQAFLYVSSTVVYNRREPGRLHLETDPLGGTSTPQWVPAYGATKISGEAAVRALAVALGLPSIIARLSVQYGGFGGLEEGRGGLPARFFRLMRRGEPVPVRPGGDDFCNPLHVDDIVRHVPKLWDAATVPATVVNWGGDDRVGARELCDYIAELTGTPVMYEETEAAAGMVAVDSTVRRSITGSCSVRWHEGVARTIEETVR